MNTGNVTLEMVYGELLAIRKKLSVVEHAIIPIEKLEKKELEEHKKDLETALKEEKISLRSLKK